MRTILKTTLILFVIMLGNLLNANDVWTNPRTYVCYRAAETIILDGNLNELSWQNAPWTEDFIDIEGEAMPKPLYRTRVKMLWDDEFLYIAAELEEPHIWATFTQRESIVFHENNFEVFIDPSGDTHNYYELEINALGTIWDLMLTKPYRNGGIPISAWDIAGFRYGIKLGGTLNDPTDIDSLWVVEMALPWKILAEAAPQKRKPMDGEQWRINFSRVQWRLDIIDGNYQKTIDTETKTPFPEYNWVWSPQGVIDMHLPERWGYVQFSDILIGKGTVPFYHCPDEKVKLALRKIYHWQNEFLSRFGVFATSIQELIEELAIQFEEKYHPIFESGNSRFKISIISSYTSKKWNITEDSRVWSSN